MEIKGDRHGLTVIAEGFTNEGDLIDDLAQTLSQRAAFLATAQLQLVIRGMRLTSSLLTQVGDVFSRFPSLTLAGVKVDGPNMVAPIPLHRGRELKSPLVVRHAIRSGQRIFHEGDVVVVGDVNPGATVIAAGDVMVFGRLRGVAYAGQPGDRTKGVYALRFEPSQIRIGEVLAIGDGQGGRPEWAHVEEGSVVVNAWNDVNLPDVVLENAGTRSTNRQATLS